VAVFECIRIQLIIDNKNEIDEKGFFKKIFLVGWEKKKKKKKKKIMRIKDNLKPQGPIKSLPFPLFPSQSSNKTYNQLISNS